MRKDYQKKWYTNCIKISEATLLKRINTEEVLRVMVGIFGRGMISQEILQDLGTQLSLES